MLRKPQSAARHVIHDDGRHVLFGLLGRPSATAGVAAHIACHKRSAPGWAAMIGDASLSFNFGPLLLARCEIRARRGGETQRPETSESRRMPRRSAPRTNASRIESIQPGNPARKVKYGRSVLVYPRVLADLGRQKSQHSAFLSLGKLQILDLRLAMPRIGLQWMFVQFPQCDFSP